MIKQGVNSDGEVIRGVYVEHAPVDAPYADDGLTRQEFADECDINFILQRYEKTGVINHYNTGDAQYLDLEGMPTDLQESLLYVEMANESFMKLPAVVRREFDNDPIKFAEFAVDPKNIDKLREWKLAAPKPDPKPAAPAAEPVGAGGEPAPG